MATASTRLDVPALPDRLPASWVARRPVSGDAGAIHALCCACDVAVLGIADISLVDIEADVTRPSADPTTNQLVVVDGDRAVAWVWLDDYAAGEVRVDLYVERTLPTETADAVAGWAWEFLHARAAEVTASHGRTHGEVSAGSNAGDAIVERWLDRWGFRRTRTFWRMRCDVTSEEPPPVHPSGVVVRPVEGTDTSPGSDLRTIHRLHEEAFSDHWNFHPRDFDTWWGQMQSSAGLDLGLWWIAEVDGEPGGLFIGTNQLVADGGMYVDTLGTVHAARRRGVAVTMLRESFAEAARRGLDKVCLNVDSENPTGATRLYESVGMHVEFAVHQWHRELTV